MNVLITCAGRRTTLVELFQDAVGPDGSVLAADMDALAPARRVADIGFGVPPVDDADYPEVLLDIVRSYDVDLVIPTIDPELSGLADLRQPLAREGARAVVSDASLLNVAADKWETTRHFQNAGFRVPETWNVDGAIPSGIPDPAFVKPRRGSSSEGARAVARSHLAGALASVDEPMIQEVVDAPEVTVDALFDFDGRLLHFVPRLRIRTLSGESIQGRTLPPERANPWLEDVLTEVGVLGARGPVTLQAFLTDGEPTLSEINPRFGGGFPLTHRAGGRYPEWLLDLHAGTPREPQMGDYESGLVMTRALTEYFVRP
jgi:carbamoyl-phosphate synthase large subunit